jgi:nucleotide-binding universal stress UspA family protein
MKTIALALDGVDDEELIKRALPWIPRFEHVEVWCAYGDVALRELAHQRERYGRHQPPPPPPPHGPDPDRAQAEAIAKRGVDLLHEQNIEATSRILGDRDPGHALAAATSQDVVLFLAAGHRGGIGPKSIGHVARFVIDHATGPVILIRM